MIIIKFGILASYTKKLHSIFNSLSNNYNALDSSGILFPKEIINNYYRSFDLHLNHLVPENKFVFSTIEDINDFSNDPISSLKEICGQKIVILPIVPIKDRITSIVLRKNGIIDRGYLNCKTLECFVRAFFDFHSYSTTGKIKKSDYMTVDRVIFYKEFEDLVELHNNKVINLVLISKETILNNEEKILESVGFDISMVIREPTFNSKIRMSKVEDTERTIVLEDILQKYDTKIKERELEIRQIASKNKMEII